MDEDSFRQFETFLDFEKKNKLFVKFKYMGNSPELEEFVLIYLTQKEDFFVEVIKYDFSQKEKLHMHHYKEPKKIYLNEVPNIETLARLYEFLSANWRILLVKYEER